MKDAVSVPEGRNPHASDQTTGTRKRSAHAPRETHVVLADMAHSHTNNNHEEHRKQECQTSCRKVCLQWTIVVYERKNLCARSTHARHTSARTTIASAHTQKHAATQPRSHAATQPTGTRARRRKGTQACTGQPDTSQAILTTQDIHSRGTWWDTISTRHRALKTTVIVVGSHTSVRREREEKRRGTPPAPRTSSRRREPAERSHEIS